MDRCISFVGAMRALVNAASYMLEAYEETSNRLFYHDPTARSIKLNTQYSIVHISCCPTPVATLTPYAEKKNKNNRVRQPRLP